MISVLIYQFLLQADCVLKSLRRRKLPFFLKHYVLDVVSAPKSAHLRQSILSSYLQTWTQRRHIDMAQIVSSFIDCQRQEQGMF